MSVAARSQNHEPPGAAADTVSLFEKVEGFGEQVLDVVTWEFDERVLTVYPTGGYSSRNGLEFGVMPALSRPGALPGQVNTVNLSLEFSTRGMLQLQAEYEWFINPRWQSRGMATFSRRNDRFWPGGNTSYLTFRHRAMAGEAEMLRRLSSALWAGLRAHVSRNSFSRVEYPPHLRAALFPVEDGTAVGVGPLVMFDSRDRVLSPRSGMLWRAQYLQFGAFGAGSYQYGHLLYDARWYHKAIAPGGVLAAQLMVEHASEEAPFWALPYLGGADRLRGIGHPWRKTGQAMWLTRLEFRQPLWWRLGGVLFAGGGKAAPHFRNPFNGAVGSFGAGLRFRMLPHQPLHIRFDTGFSSFGDSGFFISLKEAF